MIFRFVTFLFFFSVSHLFAALPPVVFNSVSPANGLPQNSGRILLQDADGFIWIGTEDGLVRFDGESMLSFRQIDDDPNSLSDNYVDSLAEDEYGRIWVGTIGGGLNVIDKKRESLARIKMLSSSDIRDLSFCNFTKKLWIGTGEGLYVLDTDAAQLERDFDTLSSPVDLSVEKVQVLLPDGNEFKGTISGVVADGNDIWLCTRGSGILHYNCSTSKSVWFTKGEQGLEDNTFNTIFKDRDGTLWIGGQNSGLVRVIRKDSEVHFRHFHTTNSSISANDIMTVADAADDKLWVGTWNGGLALFDKKSGEVDSYNYQHDDRFSLSSDIILDVIQAKNGQIWLGTFDKGVSWFYPDSPFHTYRKVPLPAKGLKSNIIWSFAAEGNRFLWVGTNKGLSRLDLSTNQYITPEIVTPNDLWEKVREDDIRALCLEGDNLWIAARKQGVFKLSLSDWSLTSLAEIAGADQKLTHPYIRLIYKDSKNGLWLGANKGLNRFDLTTGQIRNYTVNNNDNFSLPHYRIRALFEDKNKQIWVGTSSGLLLLDVHGNPINVFKFQKNDKSGFCLAGSGVRGVREDNQGRLWFATNGGVSVYDPAKKETVILREKNGLPSNTTYSSLWANGYMWVTTLNGLARIDPATFQVETYTSQDGLPDNEFNFNAWHQLPDNRLVLGTLSGFTVFQPDKILGREPVDDYPPLYLKPYKYENEVRVSIDLNENEVINLDWDNSKISFRYGVLNYNKSGTVLYEFKLDGVSDVWTKVDSPRLMTFNGLSAGTYSFSIRARDIHGLWSLESRPIKFKISKEPWKTIPAYFGYLVCLCLILAFTFSLYHRRLHKHSLYLEKLIAERTGELKTSNDRLTRQHVQLDQLIASRERLFRAIAHELRTPLAVIISSLESLLEEDKEPATNLRVIHNRANRMSKLINNLLELTCKGSSLKTVEQPFLVKPALEEALFAFRPKIAKQERLLEELIELNRECLLMNRETFIMIVSNLLSNACKFTDERGRITITCSCDDENVTLSVEDNGIGVSLGDEEKIFEWFGRATSDSGKEGWGIGLAFVRDEVEAIGGTIELVRDGAPGAQFVVKFPLLPVAESKIPLLDENLSGNRQEEEVTVLSNLEKNYSILIIEDDPDLRSHLSTLFPANWKKLTASDAESGVAIAMEEEPDIIITDLMLPGESGFDATRKLKEDPKTQHIPVIILTALESEENRLTSLGLSADSFLGKPFSNKELLLRVGGLLSNRERLLTRAKQVILSTYSLPADETDQPLVTGTPESDFLATINEKLGHDRDVSFMTLDEAAKKLAMSKRSLQREMERVGISWREYKRFKRMHYAMDLLGDKKKQIGEIAEMTGYSSAAHFSKTFKDMTGKSPTEWRRSLG